MRVLRRTLLYIGVLFLGFYGEPAHAQRSGAGLFQGANMCSDVVGQINGETWCLDRTTGSLNVWTTQASFGVLTQPRYQMLSGNLPSSSANTNNAIVINNLSSGSQASSTVYVGNDVPDPPPNQQQSHYGALQLNGSGNTVTGLPGDSFVLGTNVNNDMFINSAVSNIRFEVQGLQNLVSMLQQTDATYGVDFLGMSIGGFAPVEAEGKSVTSFSVGNAFMTAANWANVDIHGASRWNGTQWITDCGSGSGIAMLSVGPGPGIAMYSAPAPPTSIPNWPCDYPFNWTPIGSWSSAGTYISHIVNLPSAPEPSVTSGQLRAGSRDTSGLVMNITGSQTTLTFGQPMTGVSLCTLTDAGQAYEWYDANQTNTSVTFVCRDPENKTSCPGGQWVEYTCMDSGA